MYIANLYDIQVLPLRADNVIWQCDTWTDTSTLDCSHLALTEFVLPPDFNTSIITTLILKDNQLRLIPELSALGNLENLDLSGSEIRSVTDSDLLGLHRLIQLDLSMNEGFTLSNDSITPTAFRHVPKLKTLK